MLFSKLSISALNKTNHILSCSFSLISFSRRSVCSSFLTVASICRLYTRHFTFTMSYMEYSFKTYCKVKFVNSSDFCVKLRSVDFTDVKPFTMISLSLSTNLKPLVSIPLLLETFAVFSKRRSYSTKTLMKVIFILYRKTKTFSLFTF